MANISIVVGSFHKAHADRMVADVRAFCSEKGHTIASVVWVPGSMEKPLALKRVLETPEIDGAVVLGIIERGETAHGLVMANSVIASLIDLQLRTDKPVGIGILGPEIFPGQIEPRVVPYARAAVVALDHMLRM